MEEQAAARDEKRDKQQHVLDEHRIKVSQDRLGAAKADALSHLARRPEEASTSAVGAEGEGDDDEGGYTTPEDEVPPPPSLGSPEPRDETTIQP